MRLALVWLVMLGCGREDGKAAKRDESAKPAAAIVDEVRVRPDGPVRDIDEVAWAEVTYEAKGRRLNPTQSGVEMSATTGDVTRDGVRDAVVVIDHDVGKYVESHVWVFTVRDGRARHVATLGTTRQKSVRRIYGAEIDDGDVVIERLFCEVESEEESIGCPREVQAEVWRWDGTRFAEDVAKREKRVP